MLPFLNKRLLAQAGEDKDNLGRLLSGATLFFLGMGLVFYSEHFVGDSLRGEITALIGLAFAIVGGAYAAYGYIGLSVVRLLKFLKDDNK